MRVLQAPPEPPPARDLRIDRATTPTRLTLRVMGGAPRYTVPAAVLSITHQVGEALVPVLMGIAIERAVSTGDPVQLIIWLAALAADFVLLSFSWRFGSRLAELGMLVVQHRLRTTVTGHLLRRVPRPGHASEQPGVALAVSTSDVARVSEAAEIAVYPVGQLAAVVFGGGVLLTVAWPLGIAVLLGVPVVLWLTERAGRSLRDRSGDEQEAAASAAGRAADLLAGYRVVRGLGAETEAARRYRAASRAALGDTLRARRAESVFGASMSVVTGLFLVAVAVTAALFAVSGGMGIGELIAVVGLAQFLIDPLRSLALQTGGWWASATASAARVLDTLLDTPLAPEDAAHPAVHASPPSFSDLAPLSDLAPGEVVAVDVDGTCVAELLAHIAARHPDALVVPHAAHLFAGTVRENVLLPGVDAEEAENALHAAACDDLARLLPQGLDTRTGENGAALSGGQRQRVALARALARAGSADLLVLHDPTTAVDAVTEARIASRLVCARPHGRTVVVTRSPAFRSVAHRVIRIAPPDVASGPQERGA